VGLGGGVVTQGENAVSSWSTTQGSQANTCSQAQPSTGGVPRRVGSYIRIILSLGVWFCDHSEWWGVWWLWRWCGVTKVTVGGHAAPPWEEGLGLLVVELIFTYVCVSLYQ
jgi:hypothetical protein